jgi:hypothetical protein
MRSSRRPAIRVEPKEVEIRAMTDTDKIALTDAVSSLRAELEHAITEAQDARLKFEAIDVTMQFQVGITQSKDGRGGLKFWVLELGGGLARSDAETQTVTLKLKPVLADGRPVQIARAQSEIPLAGGG